MGLNKFFKRFLLFSRLFGDLNSKTPMTIVSQDTKFGIKFRSSTYFNFRGFKLQYLVSIKQIIETSTTFLIFFVLYLKCNKFITIYVMIDILYYYISFPCSLYFLPFSYFLQRLSLSFPRVF